LYDSLELAQDQKAEGFKVNPKDSHYYLRYGFRLPKEIYENLFEHQKVGVTWLYNLYNEGKGGVLGDDMGLGKTVQICAYLKGQFEALNIKRALIVVPATMKSYWEGELAKWCPGAPFIMAFDNQKKSDRE
jgi:SNF2 family DNA or RNA helicase